MNRKFVLTFMTLIVYSIEDAFTLANEIKTITFNTIAMVISTDILITKAMNNSSDLLRLLQIQIADETGVMRAILKNNQIHKIKLGKEFIFRNVKAEVINDTLVLICDENSIIFPSAEPLVNIEKIQLEKDFSKVKISRISTDIIN